MTPRECVKAAIAHQDTDRAPYFIEFCSDAREMVKRISDAAGKTFDAFIDNDLLDVPAPWWWWHELPAEWAQSSVPASRPTVLGTGSYDEMTDCIKAARDNNVNKYLIVRIYGSHFEKANFARGIENVLADMAGEPEFAKRLHNLIIEKNMVMLENFLHLPEIDGVMLGSDWGSQKGLLMSPSIWDDLIRPGEQKEYDLIHGYGKDVWVHSCGDIQTLIPRLIEMGLDVLNPVQPEVMDIRMLKEKYGRKLTFWGGISTQRTLPFGTPDDVKAEARAVRDLMSAGGGYIFSPAQSIQSDVPLQNIVALLEVARERKQ